MSKNNYMTDLNPARIWRVQPQTTAHALHGLASWGSPKHAGPSATEYVRADLAPAPGETPAPAPGVERDAVIERMAKAIYEAHGEQSMQPETWPHWGETYGGHYEPWRRQARAALAAYEKENRDG